jgi:hypothetical protein
MTSAGASDDPQDYLSHRIHRVVSAEQILELIGNRLAVLGEHTCKNLLGLIPESMGPPWRLFGDSSPAFDSVDELLRRMKTGVLLGSALDNLTEFFLSVLLCIPK